MVRMSQRRKFFFSLITVITVDITIIQLVKNAIKSLANKCHFMLFIVKYSYTCAARQQSKQWELDRAQ